MTTVNRKRPISDVSRDVEAMEPDPSDSPAVDELRQWARESIKKHGVPRAAKQTRLTVSALLRLASGSPVREITRRAAASAFRELSGIRGVP